MASETMFVALRIVVRAGEMRREALVRECERCGLTFPAVIPLPAPFYPLRYQTIHDVPLASQSWSPGVMTVEYVD